MDFLSAFAQVAAAYVVMDAMIGLYHWATDAGYNTPSRVAMFVEHHIDPLNMVEFDWQPMPWGLGVMAVGLWLLSPFVTAFGAFLMLAQVPHYYTHRPSRSQSVRSIVRQLQRWRVIATPQSHALHHDGVFNRNFCVLSGWNDFWLNRLVKWVQHG